MFLFFDIQLFFSSSFFALGAPIFSFHPELRTTDMENKDEEKELHIEITHAH